MSEAPASRDGTRVAPRARTAPPLGSYRRPTSDRVADATIKVLAMAAVWMIALIFVFVGKEAVPLFFDAGAQAELGGLSALFEARSWPGYDAPERVWQPVGELGKFNVVPLCVGTLKITVIAMAIAVPFSILAAIFVSQYAGRRWREVLKPSIELLASVPSVVLGFFALIMLASALQSLFDWTYRLNAVVAGIGLAIAVAPIVFTVSEDALSAVPKDLEAGALALGARKHQVVLRIVLPAALPGIAAAIILGFGRAIGETMIVLMASGNAAVIELFDPGSSARTITATVASELGEVAQGDAHWRVLFLLGTMLFLVTFVLNRLASSTVERLARRFGGGTR